MRRCRPAAVAAAAAYRGFSVGIIKKMACCRRRTPPQNVTVMRDKAVVPPSVSPSLQSARQIRAERGKEGRKQSSLQDIRYEFARARPKVRYVP